MGMSVSVSEGVSIIVNEVVVVDPFLSGCVMILGPSLSGCVIILGPSLSGCVMILGSSPQWACHDPWLLPSVGVS